MSEEMIHLSTITDEINRRLDSYRRRSFQYEKQGLYADADAATGTATELESLAAWIKEST